MLLMSQEFDKELIKMMPNSMGK